MAGLKPTTGQSPVVAFKFGVYLGLFGLSLLGALDPAFKSSALALSGGSVDGEIKLCHGLVLSPLVGVTGRV